MGSFSGTITGQPRGAAQAERYHPQQLTRPRRTGACRPSSKKAEHPVKQATASPGRGVLAHGGGPPLRTGTLTTWDPRGLMFGPGKPYV